MEEILRHGSLTTKEAIEILRTEGSIYWTPEEFTEPQSNIDWEIVAQFFSTEEIHTFCNGYVTRRCVPQ